MAETTQYLVESIYVTRDRSSAALKSIDRHSQMAARASMGLRRTLMGVGAVLAGGSLLSGAKRAFIDLNSSVEQSRISIAASAHLLQGGSWEKAMQNATALQEHYQTVAKKSVGETKDFVAMHQAIQPAALKAGVGMKDLTAIVEGATVAGQAFGQRADVVALDLRQMLAGTVTARDQFAQLILASQKIEAEQFNALGENQRREIVIKGLNADTFTKTGDALSRTFAGVTSTFKDELEITLRRAGLPLFERITAEVQKWNAWIEKNPEKIQEFADKFAKALVTGFEAVKGVMSWIVEHKDLLLKLAEAALVLKGARMAGGFVGGMLGSKIGSKAGTVATVAAGGFWAGKELRGMYDERLDREQTKEDDRKFLKEIAQDIRKGQAVNPVVMDWIKRKGFVDKEGSVNQDRLKDTVWYNVDREFVAHQLEMATAAEQVTKAWESAVADTQALHAAAQSVTDAWVSAHNQALLTNWYHSAPKLARQMVDTWVNTFETAHNTVMGLLGKETKGQTEQRADTKPAPTNITIQKMEVPAKDPDRWIGDFSRAVEKRIRAPRQAKAALRGGF